MQWIFLPKTLMTAGKMADFREVRQTAMAILNRTAMSRHSLLEKLTRRGVEPALAAETADWLEQIGALNDAQYAEDLVRHYIQKGFGARRIREELRKRGLDSETAEAALAGAESSAVVIDRFVQRQLKGGKPSREELLRIAGALQRRGHAWAEIRAALDRYQVFLEDEGFDKSC